jgi:hypothetical protein
MREHPGPVTLGDLDGECGLCGAPLGPADSAAAVIGDFSTSWARNGHAALKWAEIDG